MNFNILKVDAPQYVVYGWGNVSVDESGLVTDRQGDQISPQELELAVIDFMENSAASGVMHEGHAVAIVVASFVTTPDIMRAFFGTIIPEENLEAIPIGWILGVKVLDPAVFRDVLSGKLRAFSIQGSADRIAHA